MKELTLYELFKGYDDILIPKELDTTIIPTIALSASDVSASSVLFITEKVGGSEIFCTESLDTSPYAIVASKTQELSGESIPIIRVGNVRVALAYALSNTYKIDYSKVRFIGITGTNGKTTTATLIHHILQEAGYKAGFIGTGRILSGYEVMSESTYSMTTPDPSVLYPAVAKMYEDGCKYIVMEVSSHSIALGKIAPIKFEYGIFTNLSNDHLDFHKTKEEYFKAKLKLFESTKTALFNLDDGYSRRASELVTCKASTFGIIRQGDAYATEIDLSLDKTCLYYREKNLITKMTTSLIGAFNVYNSVAAMKCVIDLGVKPCIAKRAIESITGIDGRMEMIKDDITVVIDYAHTPLAFYNCLKILKQNIKHKQKLIAVFGCGGNRDPSKRPDFGKYAEEYADEIIITEDNSRNEDFDKIASGIASGMTHKRYKIISDREDAIRYAISNARHGDIVAIIGKGHEKYKITKSGYSPFDEKKIVESALQKRRSNYESRA